MRISDYKYHKQSSAHTYPGIIPAGLHPLVKHSLFLSIVLPKNSKHGKLHINSIATQQKKQHTLAQKYTDAAYIYLISIIDLAAFFSKHSPHKHPDSRNRKGRP